MPGEDELGSNGGLNAGFTRGTTTQIVLKVFLSLCIFTWNLTITNMEAYHVSLHKKY